MRWKEEIRDASFRGVPFFVEQTGLDGGRRTVTHEYPFRDVPYTEDLGRRAETIPVEGYVVGDDYMDARDRLRKACTEEEGPGELIHPFYGTMQVLCVVFSAHESTDEGRICRFSMQFVEAGEKRYPKESRDMTAATDAAAGELTAASENAFADEFSIEGLSEFQIGVVIELFESVAGVVGALFAVSTKGLVSSIVSLLNLPPALASFMTGILSTVGESEEKRLAALSGGTVGNRGFAGGLSPGKLAERVRYATGAKKSIAGFISVASRTWRPPIYDASKRNHDAVVELVRNAAVAEAAKLAVRVPFVSSDEALFVRKSLLSVMDERCEMAGSDGVYGAMTNLRGALVAALPVNAFPDILTVPVSSPICSLRLAYEVYENALYCDDIVLRNMVRHPGFIPMGTVRMVRRS